MPESPIAQPDGLRLTPERASTRPGRLTPVDALRGAIMIVMALDHANAFIAHQHPRPEIWNGALPIYPNAPAFFTRWLTHLAAPGFFFLMGVGATLFAEARRKSGWTTRAVTLHLIVRGLILIALQLLVEDPVWPLAQAGRLIPIWEGGSIYFGVLYGLGAALIAGSLLLKLRSEWLIGLSLVTVLLTHVLIPNYVQGVLSPWARLLLVPGDSQFASVLYPVIPWLGVTLFGLVFGRWLLADRAQAYRRALRLGAGFLLLFVVLRAAGGFGNIRSAPGVGWMAFLNVVKYPPSLVFSLVTLGIDLVLLVGLTRLRGPFEGLTRLLAVFGSSPLIFYVAHLYLYGAIGRALTPDGSSLATMYPLWLAGLVILYPVCWAFGKFKRRQPEHSVWRFF